MIFMWHLLLEVDVLGGGGAGLNQKVRRKALIKLKYKKLGKNICQKMNRRRCCERWLGMEGRGLGDYKLVVFVRD